jgi:putative ABC transport system permease protein
MNLWSRIRNTFAGKSHADEIEDELRAHLDLAVASGQDRREARLRLGNPARIKEETRAIGIVDWLDSLLTDARYGLRQGLKTPGLAFAVVASLAIGIGANTAIFSLVDAAILRPLPVPDPTSLVILEWRNDGFPPGVTNVNGEARQIPGGRRQVSSVSASIYRRLAAGQTAFQSLMATSADAEAVAVSLDAAPAEVIAVQYVSSNFFQGLGVVPPVGRAFRDDEDRLGGEPVVIVSHRFWKSRMSSNHALDGRIRVNNTPAHIIGVAPDRFFGLMPGQWPDLYAPLAAKVAFQAPPGSMPRAEDEGNWWVRQIGRLRSDVSADAAAAQLAGPFRQLAVPNPAGVDAAKIPELVAVPGRRGFGELNATDTQALVTLMLLVGMLLLIVCANVANLLLSRSVARQHESAVRLALGAGRLRVFRQHLVESVVFAVLGGTAGLACGYALAQGIHLLFQAGRGPMNAFDLEIDLRMLAYGGTVSVLAAVLFGVAPAARAARTSLGDALKSHTRSVTGRLRLPRLLVAAQIALSFAGLVAAGLLGRTLENLTRTDLGFDRENLAYLSVNPSRAGYAAERIAPFSDRVAEALRALPGVIHVSTVAFRPLSGMGNNGVVNFPGRPLNAAENRANLNSVGVGFFETVGIPILAGRAFDEGDIRPDPAVVVVDDAFVRRFFPGENPIGRRFAASTLENSRYEIVGVVGSSRYNSLRDDLYPTVYEPFVPTGGTLRFAIRSATDVAQLADTARRAVSAIDPAVPLAEFHLQTTLIDYHLRTERLLGFLSGAFGGIALTLAAIGLGGLLAYGVARRTNEIGVRIALGAATGDVVRMVLGDSLRTVAIGMLIGLPCAYAVARVLRTTLFRLEPLDPLSVAISCLALLTIALVAAWVPARRAARIDPIAAVRLE